MHKFFPCVSTNLPTKKHAYARVIIRYNSFFAKTAAPFLSANTNFCFCAVYYIFSLEIRVFKC